jgi:hypothetical protein
MLAGAAGVSARAGMAKLAAPERRNAKWFMACPCKADARPPRPGKRGGSGVVKNGGNTGEEEGAVRPPPNGQSVIRQGAFEAVPASSG